MRRRTFSYFLLAVLVLFGFLSLSLLPKESAPDVQVPLAIITTPYPGATATQVEEITRDIEKAIKSINGIDNITSESSDGFSAVTVKFNQGENIDDKIDEVKKEVDKIDGKFPDGVFDTEIHDIKFSDAPIFTFSIASNQNKFDLRKITDDLVDEIEGVNGVSKISHSGISEYEISINLDESKMMKYNLSLNEIQQKIKSSDINFPVGNIDIKNQKFILSLNTKINNVSDLENIPLKNNGKNIIYLKDISSIEKDLKEQNVISEISFSKDSNLKKAIIFSVSKNKGFNIINLTDSLKEKLETLSKKDGILHGLDYVITMNLGKEARKDMVNLSNNGFMAVLLVFMILVFVLGFKDSFVAAIGIPISFLLAFIFFYLVGNTLNFISLFSMILAIGILVDSDIVITEGIAQKKKELKNNINNKLEGSELEMEASILAVKELSGPMLAGTATTIAVFSPLFFLSGVTGDFIKGIPFTVVFILIASQIVSIFVVPLLHSSKYKIPFYEFWKKIFKLKDKKKENKKEKKNKLFDFKTTQKKYRKLLDYIFDRKIRENLLAIAVVVGFLASLYLPFSGAVKSEFFPGGDVPLIYMNLELDKGSSKEDVKKYIYKVKEKIESETFYSSMIITLGKTSEFKEGGGQSHGDRFGNILLNIKDGLEPQGKTFLNNLRNILKENNFNKISASAPQGGPPNGAPIDFRIVSNNAKNIEKSSILAEEILSKIDGVINVKSQLDKNNIGFDFNVNREKAELFGVSIASASNKILSATKGVELMEIKNNSSDYKVYLKINLNKKGNSQSNINPDDILQMTLKNNFGKKIPMSSFIDVIPKNINSQIFHYDGKNSIRITAEGEDGFELLALVKNFKKKFFEKNNNDSQIIFGGAFESQQKSFGETGMAFIAGILLIFGILIFLFNSYRLPLIIESVIPLAFTGVVVGLWITGSALSFPAILGFVALSGIVVNNSIILIYVYEELRKKKILENGIVDENDILEIVKKGSILRIRPIILTTITTILGVIPLITTSAMWAPIAYTIIFGLLFATIITLIFIPILYKKWYPKK